MIYKTSIAEWLSNIYCLNEGTKYLKFKELGEGMIQYMDVEIVKSISHFLKA